MDDHTKSDITQALYEMISEVMPDAVLRDKYGGTVIERIAGQPATQCGGVFVYSHHVSLEFTLGVRLSDPHGLLEGGGKLRRHLKLRSREHVQEKSCRAFLEQASRI